MRNGARELEIAHGDLKFQSGRTQQDFTAQIDRLPNAHLVEANRNRVQARQISKLVTVRIVFPFHRGQNVALSLLLIIVSILNGRIIWVASAAIGR